MPASSAQRALGLVAFALLTGAGLAETGPGELSLEEIVKAAAKALVEGAAKGGDPAQPAEGAGAGGRALLQSSCYSSQSSCYSSFANDCLSSSYTKFCSSGGPCGSSQYYCAVSVSNANYNCYTTQADCLRAYGSSATCRQSPASSGPCSGAQSGYAWYSAGSAPSYSPSYTSGGGSSGIVDAGACRAAMAGYTPSYMTAACYNSFSDAFCRWAASLDLVSLVGLSAGTFRFSLPDSVCDACSSQCPIGSKDSVDVSSSLFDCVSGGNRDDAITYCKVQATGGLYAAIIIPILAAIAGCVVACVCCCRSRQPQPGVVLAGVPVATAGVPVAAAAAYPAYAVQQPGYVVVQQPGGAVVMMPQQQVVTAPAPGGLAVGVPAAAPQQAGAVSSEQVVLK